MSKAEVKYTLEYPINVDGVEHKELTVRRIKGKDLKLMDRQRDGLSKGLFLIHHLTGLPPESLDDMDGADIEGLTEIIEGFSKRRR